MVRPRHIPRHPRRGGFTLIELLVSIAIILVLVGLMVVGINGALRFARSSADRQLVASLKLGVEQFRSELGFLPPLVVDGRPLNLGAPAGPLDAPSGGKRRPVIRPEEFLELPNTDINADRRYSKYSLTYYLMGACDVDNGDGAPVDGVLGPSFRAPRADGAFDSRNRVYEPFFTPPQFASLVRGYFDEYEFSEHGVAPTNADRTPGQEHIALADRNGRAVRYYRWSNARPPANTTSRGQFLNIPRVFQNPLTRSDTNASAADDNIELASSSYAIVGAGPDGLFGTEPISVLQARYGSAAVNEEDLRRRAWLDNIVEVGR
ncbi:MAG: type II secretion system protein [Phycisphaeraceae bacterium]|nr:type II secretion system protein [Phycisphaeraceae bacterium]